MTDNLPAPTTDMHPVAVKEKEFELVQREAKMLAASHLVPKHFQGNVPDCVIAMEMAQRLGSHVLPIMQSLYVVHGRPGFSGQFIHAMLNCSGIWEPLTFEYEHGRDKEITACTASSRHIKSGKVQSITVTWDMVCAEGWNRDKGPVKSKWNTHRQLMFTYRAASHFCKAYAPELLLGMQSVEEIQDMGPLDDVQAKSVSATIYTGDGPSMPAESVDEARLGDENAHDVESFEGQQGQDPEDQREDARMREHFSEPQPDPADMPGTGHIPDGDPHRQAEYGDLPDLDEDNWWSTHEHWKFRKGFDFFLTVMAGFNYPFPDQVQSVVIDGTEYELGDRAREQFMAFKDMQPRAVGTLRQVGDDTMGYIRKKFIFNLKIDGSLFEAMDENKPLFGDPLFDGGGR